MIDVNTRDERGRFLPRDRLWQVKLHRWLHPKHNQGMYRGIPLPEGDPAKGIYVVCTCGQDWAL